MTSKKIILGMLIVFVSFQSLQAGTEKNGSIWSYCVINPKSPIKDRREIEKLMKTPVLTFGGFVLEVLKRVGGDDKKPDKLVRERPLSEIIKKNAKKCGTNRMVIAAMKVEGTEPGYVLFAGCAIVNRNHSFERFAKKMLVPVAPMVLEMEGYFGSVMQKKVMERAQADMIYIQSVYGIEKKKETGRYHGALSLINVLYFDGKNKNELKLRGSYTIDNPYYAYVYDMMIFDAKNTGKGTLSDWIVQGAKEAIADPSKIGTGANERFVAPFLIFVPDFYVKTFQMEQSGK